VLGHVLGHVVWARRYAPRVRNLTRSYLRSSLAEDERVGWTRIEHASSPTFVRR